MVWNFIPHDSSRIENPTYVTLNTKIKFDDICSAPQLKIRTCNSRRFGDRRFVDLMRKTH
jgi:hypothetical protein